MEAGAIAALVSTLVALASLVLVVVAFASARKGRRRLARTLSAWAHQQGWTYTWNDNRLRDYFPERPTGGGTVGHALAGRHKGYSVLAFESRYTGDRPTVYQVVAIQTPAGLPWLEVSKELFQHKLLAGLGIQDLQVGDQRFDEQFRIRTDDDAFARRVLHPGFTRWMLHDPRAPEAPVRFHGHWLLTWRQDGLSVEAVLAAAEYLIDIVHQVPADVWTGRPPAY